MTQEEVYEKVWQLRKHPSVHMYVGNTALQLLEFIAAHNIKVNNVVHTAEDSISFKLDDGWRIEIDPGVEDGDDHVSYANTYIIKTGP